MSMNETENWFWCEDSVESYDVHEDRMRPIGNFAGRFTFMKRRICNVRSLHRVSHWTRALSPILF